MPRSYVKKLLAASVAVLGISAAMAQAWSPSTIKIIVPYPPGTEPDVLARDVGNALAKQTGKIFVVDNKPGANSIIGTDAVVKADGDGATLLVVDRLAVVTNPQLYSNLPYSWETSIRPISDLAAVRLVLGVREGLPVKSYADFIAFAQKNPGKINVGTGGNGHVNHIGMEMVSQAHGLSFNYVPYKGMGPAVQGLLTGEVDAVLGSAMTLQGHARSGKVHMLIVGDTKRTSIIPEVPSLADAGEKADAIPSTVFALLGPAKIPDALANQISQAVATVVNQPQFKSTYAVRGLEAGSSSPDQTLERMKSEAVKYKKIIRDAGIKIN